MHNLRAIVIISVGMKQFLSCVREGKSEKLFASYNDFIVSVFGIINLMKRLMEPSKETGVNRLRAEQFLLCQDD